VEAATVLAVPTGVGESILRVQTSDGFSIGRQIVIDVGDRQ
jgi:hypothetical protein